MDFTALSEAHTVERMYQGVLDRAADALGLSSWSGQLAAGRPSLDVLRTLYSSAEYRAKTAVDDSGFVAAAYANVLGRAPDPAGLASWVTLLAGGAERAAVMDAFVQSPEARADANLPVLAVTDWEILQVARAYEVFMGRAGDPAGIQGWRQALEQGLISSDQLATGFAESAEFDLVYGTKSNKAFLASLYQNAFDRAPDAGGSTFWQAALASGMSREQVALGVHASPESIGHLAELAASGIDVFVA